MKKYLGILLITIGTLSAAAPTGVSQSNPGFQTGPSSEKKSKLSQSDVDAPHGKGGYYYVGSGFGVQIASLPEADKTLASEDENLNQFSALCSLGLGYTTRLANDVVVGGEMEIGFPILKPKLVLGYMVSDNDQVALNFGYNILPRVLFSEKNKKNLSFLSGAGIDVSYQHFFTNGSFMRFSLITEYYGGAPNNLAAAYFGGSTTLISTNATVWDMKVGFAYGIQW